MLLPLVLDLRQARGEAGRMLTPERRLVSRSVLAREARRFELCGPSWLWNVCSGIRAACKELHPDA